MPVFDFVNSEKNKIESTKPYGLFTSFTKNLDIDSKKRNLQLTQKFLEDQLNIFRNKSKKSKQELEEFAFQNNLPINNQLNIDKFDSPLPIVESDIETDRIKVSNQIIKLDFVLEQINNMEDINDIEFISFGLPKESLEGIKRDIEKLLN